MTDLASRLKSASLLPEAVLESLCLVNGVSWHQVREVYPERPENELDMWFVATLAADIRFPVSLVGSIPLSVSAQEAKQVAVAYLKLEELDLPDGSAVGDEGDGDRTYH